MVVVVEPVKVSTLEELPEKVAAVAAAQVHILQQVQAAGPPQKDKDLPEAVAEVAGVVQELEAALEQLVALE